MIFCAFALLAALSLPAVELVSPREGESVCCLNPGNKSFLLLSADERRAIFKDAAWRHDAEHKWGSSPVPVVLKWRHAKSPAVHVTVTKRGAAKPWFEADVAGDSADVWNLEIGRTYEWTVDDGTARRSGTFRTCDMAPRVMRIAGVPNFRDLGGWKTADGRRVRQGLVYRSQGLNENADYYLNSKETMELYKEGKLEELYGKDGKEIKERLDREGGRDDFDPNAPWMRKSLPRKDPKPPKARLDEPTKAYLLDTLGIRSDVDLRGPTETWGMTGSPLGPRATWFHISSEPYRGMGMQVGKEAFARVFRVFLDRKNYPIVFHCIGGADRTGCDAWILNGLLGVSEDDLLRDWELTCFEYESLDFGHDTRLVRLLKVLDDAGGATMREKCENYVKALGFTEADLAAFRDIMLEDAAPFELSVRKVRLALGATQPFTFLHFSDTHLAVPSSKNPRSARAFAATVARIRDKGMFAVNTGDLLDCISDESLRAAGVQRGLDILTTPGNHETTTLDPAQEPRSPDDFAALSKRIAAAYGSPIPVASRIVNGVKFVAYDNAGLSEALGERALRDLEREFADGLPTVLCCHFPLYDAALFRRERAANTQKPARAWMMVGERVEGVEPDPLARKTIEFLKSRPNLKAVLSGHLHAFWQGTFNGTVPMIVAPPNYSGGVLEIEAL